MIEIIALSLTCVFGFAVGAGLVFYGLFWGVQNKRAFIRLDGDWVGNSKPPEEKTE